MPHYPIRTFQSSNDLEAWLDGLDYKSFWHAIVAHAVELPPKTQCDAMIAEGGVTLHVMLSNLRSMAANQIGQRYNLKWDSSFFGPLPPLNKDDFADL